MITGFLNSKFAKQTTIITFHNKSMALLAISTTFKICLPSTKAFWELDTTLPTIFLMQLANTLANNL